MYTGWDEKNKQEINDSCHLKFNNLENDVLVKTVKSVWSYIEFGIAASNYLLNEDEAIASIWGAALSLSMEVIDHYRIICTMSSFRMFIRVDMSFS